MNKKLKWFIGIGVAGALLTGYLAKRNMKPEPNSLPKPISSKNNLKEELSYRLSGTFNDSIKILRYNPNNPRFALSQGFSKDSFYVRDIMTDANSLTDLLNSGVLENITNKKDCLGPKKSIKKQDILSPIGNLENIIGIGYNYLEHSAEVGETKEYKDENMVAFRKEKGSLCGPFKGIKKPKDIELLDYEVELGIVIGSEIKEDTKITKDNVDDFIAGYVLVNDMSARDIQLKGGTLFDKSKGFRKGKSYDNFCPVGPILSCNGDEFNLRQYLMRNGKLYEMQEGESSEMINSPYEIIKELQNRIKSEDWKKYRIFENKKRKRNFSLKPGDLIATGTPSGVAFNFDVKYVIGCGGKKGFIKFEKKNNEKYLQEGDSLITVSKGLGYQEHLIE